jgi:hypothetical protein
VLGRPHQMHLRLTGAGHRRLDTGGVPAHDMG